MAQTSKDLLVPINLGIIGYGFVGQAVANGFQVTSNGKDTILWYDKFKESSSLEEVIKKSEIIFVCLPTPMKQDETGIDLSIFEEMIPQITKYTDNTDKIIVIKSTVIPGTTVKFEKLFPKSQFCFNPEIFLTDPTSAETVKYFANAFLSIKVTFANYFYDYCQKLGIKYEEVKKMASFDRRIGDFHLEVTTHRGFGGKCFPKDLVAIMGEFKKMGVDTSLLQTMWEYNKKIRKVHDWIEIPFAVSKKSA